MKSMISIAAIAMAATFFQCGPHTGKKVEEDQREVKNDIRSEKEKITRDLHELKNNIDKQLDAMDKHVTTTENRDRRDFETLRDTLLVERKRLEESLNEVTTSTEDAWADTKVKVNQALDDIKTEFRKIQRKIERIFESDHKK